MMSGGKRDLRQYTELYKIIFKRLINEHCWSKKMCLWMLKCKKCVHNTLFTDLTTFSKKDSTQKLSHSKSVICPK